MEKDKKFVKMLLEAIARGWRADEEARANKKTSLCGS